MEEREKKLKVMIPVKWRDTFEQLSPEDCKTILLMHFDLICDGLAPDETKLQEMGITGAITRIMLEDAKRMADAYLTRIENGRRGGRRKKEEAPPERFDEIGVDGFTEEEEIPFT